MFHYSSISTYHEDLKKGATSCQQAVTFYLDQIRQYRDLNAFVSVYGEEALRRAEALDRQRQENRPLGKLHGVVIALKDVLCYQDHPVQACSKILKGFTSIYHASAVERLLKEEAIIIGHTNCDEFAMGSTNEHSAFGPVKNGIDTTKVPGGSSGGSAVAVQMDCCMVSLGSDTGGSVRQPADFCGVLGLKPTYGRISRYGLIAYASSFDQIGLFAKKVEDLAVVLEVISGPDELDSTAAVHPVDEYSRHLTTPLKPSRIAYFKQAIENENLDPEIRVGMKTLIQQLNQKGYKVEPIDFEYINYVVPTYYVLTTAEASSNLSRYDGVKFGYRSPKKYLNLKDFYCQNRSEGFGWEVKKRIMLGTFVLSSGYYDAYFTRAQQVRQLL
ncbi:MAG: amidase family protein, partial [Chitinophagaceae bacterium]